LDLGAKQGIRYSNRMTTCPRCRTDYDEEQPHCPSCGAPRLPVNLQPRPRPRVGPFGYFCLRFAQFATLVGIGVVLVVAVLALVNGRTIQGLATLLIGGPVAIGQFVAFGLAVQYAEQRP
jgi:hypothetical protein